MCKLCLLLFTKISFFGFPCSKFSSFRFKSFFLRQFISLLFLSGSFFSFKSLLLSRNFEFSKLPLRFLCLLQLSLVSQLLRCWPEAQLPLGLLLAFMQQFKLLDVLA